MEKIKLPHRHGGGGNLALLQEQLDRVDHFQRVAEVFKLLDDATRIRVFWLLCHCEECVLNISAMMGMSSPAVSHHLRALKNSVPAQPDRGRPGDTRQPVKEYGDTRHH